MASMPLVHARSPVAAAHGAVCVSCARALSSLVLASIYQGRPPSLVTSELRRLLSEAAAVAGPSAATVATANHSPWQWLRALHPRGAAVLACGRWCGIREPTAVDPRGRPAWRVLQEVVDATRRAVLASFDRGLEEPSASAMLTVAAALADVSGEGRSGWEAQAWGALLCSAGAALVRRGCLRCARPLVGILLDALAQVDAPHPPQRDDLAASCVAVAGVVTAHLAWARAWGGAKAVSDARDLLRRTLDVPGAVYLSLHVGGARRGIAVGLAHLAYESLALGGEAVRRCCPPRLCEEPDGSGAEPSAPVSLAGGAGGVQAAEADAGHVLGLQVRRVARPIPLPPALLRSPPRPGAPTGVRRRRRSPPGSLPDCRGLAAGGARRCVRRRVPGVVLRGSPGPCRVCPGLGGERQSRSACHERAYGFESVVYCSSVLLAAVG